MTVSPPGHLALTISDLRSGHFQDNTREVTWTQNTLDQGVTRYQLYRKLGDDDWAHLAYVSQPAWSGYIDYEDSHRLDDPPEEIRYKVRAQGWDDQWSEWSNVAVVYTEELEELLGGPPDAPSNLPKSLELRPNVPNPFNLTTQIRFGLPRATRVRLSVLNTRGQTVRVLKDGEMPAGWHSVTWDGRNDAGTPVASGIYLYIIEADGKRLLRRMTLIR